VITGKTALASDHQLLRRESVISTISQAAGPVSEIRSMEGPEQALNPFFGAMRLPCNDALRSQIAEIGPDRPELS
jgi:hypothetical protein